MNDKLYRMLRRPYAKKLIYGALVPGGVAVLLFVALVHERQAVNVVPFIEMPVAALLGTSSSSTVVTSPTTSPLPGMTLTFDDEFTTFSRYTDANGNVTCNPDGKGTWQTVYYFCSRTNPGNNEAEVYIDPGFLAYLKNESRTLAEADRENPFSVKRGVLFIKAATSSPLVLAKVGPWARYTSGLITTQFSFSQTYGYFEVRAKLPVGQGLWPAFWLLPADKTWPPEVDAFEAFGGPSPSGEGGVNLIHYASHATDANNSCGSWHNVGVNITQGFHTYGVDVEPQGITYYFDGVAYAHCAPNPELDKPLYLLINLAVGGPGSWPGPPTVSTTFPAYLQIDYVRVYQKNMRS